MLTTTTWDTEDNGRDETSTTFSCAGAPTKPINQSIRIASLVPFLATILPKLPPMEIETRGAIIGTLKTQTKERVGERAERTPKQGEISIHAISTLCASVRSRYLCTPPSSPSPPPPPPSPHESRNNKKKERKTTKVPHLTTISPQEARAHPHPGRVYPEAGQSSQSYLFNNDTVTLVHPLPYYLHLHLRALPRSTRTGSQ